MKPITWLVVSQFTRTPCKRYIVEVIRSFGDRRTEDLFHGYSNRRVLQFPVEIRAASVRKLDVINAATSLNDLRSPPGNRLETLSGNLQGFYSIRINDQWRIIFKWKDTAADQVTIIDYHR